MKKTLLLCVIALAWTPAYPQTFSCPTGTEDMLSYFLIGYPNRLSNYMGPGNANPIYSSINPEDGSTFATQGYFVWTKSSVGYPWDVKAFDGNYVYDRSTELNWNDPTTFKRFNTDLPMSPRCIAVGAAGPAIQIPISATNYSFYSNCQAYQTSNLAYVLNTIDAPITVTTTGNIGQIYTRRFRYHYGCDSSYANCSDMEVFSLGYNIGLYDWQHYVNQSGQWVLSQESIIDNFLAGQTTPYFACANTYSNQSPDFSLSATPTSQTVNTGSSTSYTVSVTDLNGFSGTITLTASGVPSGVTASFNPPSTTTTSTLTMTASSTAATGTATVTITGTSGSLSHAATVALTVKTPGHHKPHQ